MKKLIYLLSVIILTSCGYGPNDDFTFTDDVSVMQVDSVTYNVTVKDQSFTTKSIDVNLSTYAVNGTEISNINESDTCLQVICTQILTNRVYYTTYFYVFTTYDGKSSITLTNDRDQIFQYSDKINLFVNKKMIKTSKNI